MPQDFHGGEPDPPQLCAHHREVIRRAEDLDHLDHEATRDQAAQMARQCCNRLNGRTLL